MKQPKEILKTYFETGDKPTEQEFCDLIDSYHHIDSGLIVTNVVANQNGDQKISFSNGASVLVKDPTAGISTNNKIRIVNLGILSPIGGLEGGDVILRNERLSVDRLEKTPVSSADSLRNSFLENVLIQAINNLEPPLVVKEDENIIFEFDLIANPILIEGEGPIRL